MKVLYARSPTPISVAIRIDTWSSCSHVALLESDGRHIMEARFPKVRRILLEEFLTDNGEVWCKDIYCRNEAKALAWARTQIGHKYDWSALLGFPLHRDWSHTGEWWCSEYVAMAFEKGDTPLFDSEVINRIVPEHMVIIHGTPVLNFNPVMI